MDCFGAEGCGGTCFHVALNGAVVNVGRGLMVQWDRSSYDSSHSVSGLRSPLHVSAVDFLLKKLQLLSELDH